MSAVTQKLSWCYYKIKSMFEIFLLTTHCVWLGPTWGRCENASKNGREKINDPRYEISSFYYCFHSLHNRDEARKANNKTCWPTRPNERSWVVINFDDGVRPSVCTWASAYTLYTRTISLNKLMTDFADGPGGSLNSLDLQYISLARKTNMFVWLAK